MSPITYPNQRVVTVHKASRGTSFLGVNNDVWMAACRDLGYPATVLYLYLAANADNYQFALSPAAIQNALGMPRTTYRDQIRNLINKGYLVECGGNRYDFYEIPKNRTALCNGSVSVTATALREEECAFLVEDEAYAVDNETGEIIEIDNKYSDTYMESIDNTVFDFRKPIVASKKFEGKGWSIEDF